MKYKCEVCGKESSDIEDIVTCETNHKKEKACELGRVYTISINDGKGFYEDVFQVIVYEKNSEETKVCGISKFGLMYLILKDDDAVIVGDSNMKVNYSISGNYSVQPSAYVGTLNLLKQMLENNKGDIEESIKKRWGAKEVEMSLIEDKGLIGGIKIEVGDEIVNMTLRNKLEKLQDYLIKN